MVAKILPEPPFAPPPANVPSPGEEALAASARLCARIRAELERDGFMPFSRFMELALYAPGMGYYAAGATKFGRSGDFVTAPELSPLFAEALASQLVQVFAQAPARILELGAGSARLAADLIAALNRRGIRLERYSILETSADLRARQQQLLESLAPIKVARIDWLERLPERYVGVVLGNEVLDALPVRLIRKVGAEARELGLAWDSADDRPVWRARELDPELTEIVGELELPDDYTTEVHLAARGLVRSLAERLDRGVVLFIDYGFPRREYYHAERREGTLMCHYRHRSHTDPLALVGLQDISAHLDFTALAEAAVAGGLDLLGYTSQAQFLINCGILDALAQLDPTDVARYASAAARVQRLLDPAEMGELFKVIAFGRGMTSPLDGFRSGDRRGRL